MKRTFRFAQERHRARLASQHFSALQQRTGFPTGSFDGPLADGTVWLQARTPHTAPQEYASPPLCLALLCASALGHAGSDLLTQTPGSQETLLATNGFVARPRPVARLDDNVVYGLASEIDRVCGVCFFQPTKSYPERALLPVLC